VLDREIDNPITGTGCMAGEVARFATVRVAVRGMQAAIHLAALTHPGRRAGAGGLSRQSLRHLRRV
jgi:hypothetical protein